MKTTLYPFRFDATLHAPTYRLNTIPLIDILLISLFFILFQSKFLFAPGVSVDLPVVKSSLVSGSSVNWVLTVPQDNMILYDGAIYSPQSLGLALMKDLEALDTESREDIIVLLRMGKGVVLSSFFQISERIQEAGINRIHIAVDDQASSVNSFTHDPVLKL